MAEDDDERLKSNLARLRGSLDRARATGEARGPARAGATGAPRGDSGMSLAMRAGSEFISAVVVGAGIGWALDRLLRTNPAFLIVFFFIGVTAGVFNVIRLTSPKSGAPAQISPLSGAEAADKDGRRSGLTGAREPSNGRGPSGEAPGGLDDDED
jgi:ATP synthase protein I